MSDMDRLTEKSTALRLRRFYQRGGGACAPLLVQLTVGLSFRPWYGFATEAVAAFLNQAVGLYLEAADLYNTTGFIQVRPFRSLF
jgi:hypothetical protein